MKNVCFVREKKLNFLVLRFCLSQKVVQSNIDEVRVYVELQEILFEYNVQYSLLFKYKLFIQMRMAYFATILSLLHLFFGGRKETSRQLSFE